MFSKQALSDGLEVSAAQALFYLAAEPGQTVTQIARKMHLTHPAISYAMKDLVDRGLADWTHGIHDQRTREYRLTDSGWDRIEAIAGD
ncbi:MAG: MarR family winged helix-turn-helix transcriptional regulator [Solirubrobacterales bacterium]